MQKILDSLNDPEVIRRLQIEERAQQLEDLTEKYARAEKLVYREKVLTNMNPANPRPAPTVIPIARRTMIHDAVRLACLPRHGHR